jgi:hypothetical protein
MSRKQLSSVDGYRKQFLADYKKLHSWRKVASEYGLHPSMARMIANGYDPGKKIRRVLGLPPRQEVDPCPRCGEAHVTKRCTKNRRKHRTLWSMPKDVLRWAIENRTEM